MAARHKILLWVTTLVILLLALAMPVWLASRPAWSAAELATLQSLALASLEPLAPDVSNQVADDPRAVDLGRRIFHDPRFSANGQVSCATCHIPTLHFTDGRPFGRGIGEIPLQTMALAGAAYSPWFTWNGKADSQWAQALLPLENPLEHGGDRTLYAHLLAAHYGADYAALFGPLPDLADPARFPPRAGPVADPVLAAAWEQMAPEDQEAVNRVFANLGKTIAAFERTLQPKPGRFDAYVTAAARNDQPGMRAAMTADEEAGLRLFIGKAQCINCHNGPLFTNFEFHNTAVPGVPGQPLNLGRAAGVATLLADPFNCLGAYSDADPAACTQLRFLKQEGDTLRGAFKTPTLRNVTATAPYMHTGQFPDLAAVLEHYNGGGYTLVGHNELTPLNLSQAELQQLEKFLGTLLETGG